ncbi:MAG: Smr/MutS family protein [Tenericutes bacterium]|nr:Smr/MutS family protein [Mycoplasmatota bacterium]
MKSKLDDVFIENLPTLDLHGEIRSSARVLIKEFIYDNYILRNKKIVIIHGIGTGALKEELYKILKSSKYVEEYHLNGFNTGCTLIYIKNR